MLRRLLLPGMAILLAACQPPAPPPPPEVTPPVEPPLVTLPAERTGTWSVHDENGQPFDIVLFGNGQAISTWGKGISGVRGQRGFWREQAGRLIVMFDDGWTAWIQPGPESLRYLGYAPGTSMDAEPLRSSEATKVEDVGFVGIWRLNREPDGSFLYIGLLSNGTAFSTVSGFTAGRWDVDGDFAVCTWPDGWVDRIGRVDGAWKKLSTVGGETGTPSDVSEALRVGETPFQIDP